MTSIQLWAATTLLAFLAVSVASVAWFVVGALVTDGPLLQDWVQWVGVGGVAMAAVLGFASCVLHLRAYA